MEFDGVLGGKLGVGNYPQCFELGDYTGAIVICSGAFGCGWTTGGVVVGAYDDCGILWVNYREKEWEGRRTEVWAGAGDFDDDWRLGKGVSEGWHGNGCVDWDDAFDFCKKPSAGLGTVCGPIVTIIEAGHVSNRFVEEDCSLLGESCEPCFWFSLRQAGNQSICLCLVSQSRRICHSCNWNQAIFLRSRKSRKCGRVLLQVRLLVACGHWI